MHLFPGTQQVRSKQEFDWLFQPSLQIEYWTLIGACGFGGLGTTGGPAATDAPAVAGAAVAGGTRGGMVLGPGRNLESKR